MNDAIDRAEAMTEIMMFAGNAKSDEEDIYIKVSDAVQLLRELPSVTLKSIECDAISRDAVIAWFCNQRCGCGCVDRKSCPILVGIRELPPATQKSGHWITKPHVYGVAYCSECDFVIKIDDTNYCPNCGARMFEPQESEDKE